MAKRGTHSVASKGCISISFPWNRNVILSFSEQGTSHTFPRPSTLFSSPKSPYISRASCLNRRLFSLPAKSEKVDVLGYLIESQFRRDHGVRRLGYLRRRDKPVTNHRSEIVDDELIVGHFRSGFELRLIFNPFTDRRCAYTKFPALYQLIRKPCVEEEGEKNLGNVPAESSPCGAWDSALVGKYVGGGC